MMYSSPVSTLGRSGARGGIILRIGKSAKVSPVARGPKSGGIVKAKNKLRKQPAVTVAVDTITFQGVTNIHYARIPVQGIGGHGSYLRSGPEHARRHFAPPAVRPNGGPHWTTPDRFASVSWPAAYLRAAAAGGPQQLTATFRATRNFTGNRAIQATCNANGLSTDLVVVNFVDGQGTGLFTLQNVPNVVRCLSGMSFQWQQRAPNTVRFADCGASRHTLYILDAAPRPAISEQHYFEVIDWACRWADGQAGAANVTAAIWNRFTPVQTPHPSGLIYWRNHRAQVPPAQTIATAIQYQDQGIAERKASSCIVFDRVFMNCLAVHGIQSAEVKLTPAAYVHVSPVGLAIPGFMSGVLLYDNPTSWLAVGVAAHGNPLAPHIWQSHWITAVHTGAGATGWELFDPSYGLGTYACAVPALGGPLAVPAAYETAAVYGFPCTLMHFGFVLNLPSANPNPPHLTGTIVAMN